LLFYERCNLAHTRTDSVEHAVDLISHDQTVCVPDAHTAIQVLMALGLTQGEAEEQVRIMRNIH
jgi:hypothetical protein